MASPVVAEVIENSTNTAGTSHTINHPTVVADELWIIILDKGSTSASVNSHSDWTELLDEAQANGLYIAYRWTTGSEGASTTLVTSASTRTASMLYRITGAENPATQAPEIGTTGSGSSATPDPPASASPASSKDYLFIAFYGAAGEEADDNTWSDTPPTNYTPSPPRTKACGIAGSNLGGLIAAAERALTTGSAENPGTFAKDVSAAWRSQTIMVHPPAQTVSPSLITQALGATAPQVDMSASPSLISQLLSAAAPEAQLEVDPGLISQLLGATAPEVVASQSVSPELLSQLLSAIAPTVVAEQIVSPSLLSSLAVAVAPSVELRLEPGLTSQLLSALAPQANLSVSPALISQLVSATAPEVVQIVAPGLISQPLAATAPQVDESVSPALISQLLSAIQLARIDQEVRATLLGQSLAVVPLSSIDQVVQIGLLSQLLNAVSPVISSGDSGQIVSPALLSSLVSAVAPGQIEQAVNPALQNTLLAAIAPSFEQMVNPALLSSAVVVIAFTVQQEQTVSPDLLSIVLTATAPTVTIAGQTFSVIIMTSGAGLRMTPGETMGDD